MKDKEKFVRIWFVKIKYNNPFDDWVCFLFIYLQTYCSNWKIKTNRDHL